MGTGPRALVKAGDGTAGTLAVMGGGLIQVILSQAGEKGYGKSWNNSWDRGNQLPGPPQPSWIATTVASTVESAVTSSISKSLREAATSWVQSLFNRVAGNTGTSSSPSTVASESHPDQVVAPAVKKDGDCEMCDDVVCVAQRLIIKVRKAAAAEGRTTSMPKAGKKKNSRRSHFNAPSSDTSEDEVLRKRHRGQVSAHPVTLPLVHLAPPSLHGNAGDIGPSGPSRTGASSSKMTATETAWNQVRELRSLVEEQQNVICQMQLKAVDSAPLDGHREVTRVLVDTPCHAAFMIYLGCEACAELKEDMPVDTYMTFVAKKQCREWWVRKTEALLDKTDIGEETPRREMVSQLWRKFHDVVST